MKCPGTCSNRPGDDIEGTSMQSQDTTRRPVTPMSVDEGRARLIAEFGNRCFRCLAKPDFKTVLDVDHIVPVARGGINVYENFQLLCGPCNSWKHTKIIDFRPGKSRVEIRTTLPIIPNDQRVRRNKSKKPEYEPVGPQPPARDELLTAQALLIKRLRTELAYADETMSGLRDRADAERARGDMLQTERDHMADELARTRAEQARPWWRKALGLPPA